jgi:hypothetical protein
MISEDTVDFVPNYDERLLNRWSFRPRSQSADQWRNRIAVGWRQTFLRTIQRSHRRFCAQIDTRPDISIEGLMHISKGRIFRQAV